MEQKLVIENFKQLNELISFQLIVRNYNMTLVIVCVCLLRWWNQC